MERTRCKTLPRHSSLPLNSSPPGTCLPMRIATSRNLRTSRYLYRVQPRPSLCLEAASKNLGFQTDRNRWARAYAARSAEWPFSSAAASRSFAAALAVRDPSRPCAASASNRAEEADRRKIGRPLLRRFRINRRIRIFDADTPGVHRPNFLLCSLYKKLRRPIYPLDDVKYPGFQ